LKLLRRFVEVIAGFLRLLHLGVFLSIGRDGVELFPAVVEFLVVVRADLLDVPQQLRGRVRC
jgi:hypothetical protein